MKWQWPWMSRKKYRRDIKAQQDLAARAFASEAATNLLNQQLHAKVAELRRSLARLSEPVGSAKGNNR